MPVLVVPGDSKLILSYEAGTDPISGKPKFVKYTYNNVKHDAGEQDIFDVANQMVSLQKGTLDNCMLQKNMQLTS